MSRRPRSDSPASPPPAGGPARPAAPKPPVGAVKPSVPRPQPAKPSSGKTTPAGLRGPAGGPGKTTVPSKSAAASRREREAKKSERTSILRLLAILALIALIALAAWLVAGRRGPSSPSKTGAVTDCKKVPPFVTNQGFKGPAISTTDPKAYGLVLLDSADQSHRYMHPTWDDAGSLGPFVWDAAGNLYTAPVPRSNLTDNPTGLINTVYRVEASSGEMKPLVALPAPPGLGTANPYGIVGLAFDCDTSSVYVSTVGGSSKDEEIGHIYRIDPQTAKVVADLKNVDAMGLAVFNGAAGKRLYFGPAREPEIRSIALTASGDFEGEPRYEVPLTGNSRARKVTFVDAGDTHFMQVAAMPFAFSLRAASERQETQERFRYDPAKDTFEPVAAGQ